MFHSYFIVSTANLHSHSVILKPGFRLGFSSELIDSGCQLEVGRNYCCPDGSAKTLGTRNMHSAATWTISARVFSVCFVPVDQALNKNGSRIEAWLSWVDWSSAFITVMPFVIVLSRHVRRTPRRRCRHWTTIVMVELTIILPTVFMSQG